MVTIPKRTHLFCFSQKLRRRREPQLKELKAKRVEKKRRSLTTDPPLLELENRPKTHLACVTSWPPSTIPSST